MQETKKLEKTCRFLEKIYNRLESLSSNQHSLNIERRVEHVLSLLEKKGATHSHLLFLQASLYFRLAQISQKQAFYQLAHNKLQLISPQCIKDNISYNLLWAKVLVCLSLFSADDHFLLIAIKKLEALCEKRPKDYEIYWCLGHAYIFLAKRSFEVSDFRKAIENYSRVKQCEWVNFWVDYAEALYVFGSFMHDSEALYRAVEILKQVIVDVDNAKRRGQTGIWFHVLYGKDDRGYALAWRIYVKAMKRIIDIEEKPLEILDSLFYEAISAVPEERSFWMEWSELYVRQGWLRKDFTLIEKGLTHISYSFFGKTSKEIEGSSRSDSRWFEPIIFAEALVTLGLFSEELKLIKEGERIIQCALNVLPNNAEVWHALGLLNLVYGLYYSDKKYLFEAICSFKKGLETYNRSLFLWHGLFEAYFSLSLWDNNEKFFQKTLEINDHLLKLRPHSALLHYEAAIVLLQFGADDEELLYAACTEFEQSLALNNDPKYIYRYAETLDRLGEVSGQGLYFEKGIDLLNGLRARGDHSPILLYNLALLYAHLGETEEDEEILYRAHYLFESIAKKRTEDDRFFCEWGLLLLHLSQLKTEFLKEKHKLFLKAEEQFVKALELGNREAHYHLACLYSLSGYFELSLEQLQKAYDEGVVDNLEDIDCDSWLEGIRSTVAFQKFIEVCRGRES